MNTTSEKLTYLNETKSQLKDTINYAGAGLTDEPFRQYPEKLYDKYLDILKDNGEELFEGLPKATGTGTGITLNDTANTRMKMSLAPSELEQATTTGKNLAQLTLSEEGTAGGITYKPNEDGSITITGTRTSGSTKKAFSVYLEPSTRYYFNCFDRNTGEKYENSQLQGVASDFIVTINDNFRTTSSFVAGTYDLALKGSTNGASFNGTYFFSLAKEDLTTYEPYTGGIASPNPDYPQDIHTISGDNEIVVSNKNIIPFTNQDFTYKDVRYYCVNGGLYLNGTSTGETLSNRVEFKNNFSFWLNAGTYYFTRGTFNGLSLKKYIDDSNILTNSGSFTLTEKTQLYIGFYVYNKTFNNQAIECQIEVNPQATSYVSHQEQTLPLTLGTLEYCKIGNYADEFYLATESDTSLVAGKWYLKKNIGKKDISTITTWTRDNEKTNSWRFYSPSNSVPSSLSNIALTNYFKNSPANSITNIDAQALTIINNTQIVLRINKTIASTSAELLEWLQNRQVITYHILATPTYTLLNEALQQELNNIKKALSYDTQTNISQVNNDLPFVISANVVQKYFLNDELE